MRELRLLIGGLAAIIAVSFAACSGDDCVDRYDCMNKNGSPAQGKQWQCEDKKCAQVDLPTPQAPDGGTNPQPDGGVDAGTEFTAFVRDLIQNQTAENNTPTPTENKTFVDTPNTNNFPASFFQ